MEAKTVEVSIEESFSERNEKEGGMRIVVGILCVVAACNKQNDSEVARLKAELEAANAKLAATDVKKSSGAERTAEPKVARKKDFDPDAKPDPADPELTAKAPGEMTGDWLKALLVQADANKNITYAHLKKSAEKYEGKPWALTGKILEIAEKRTDNGFTLTKGRISLDWYGNQALYFEAPFSTEFVEGNVVDMAGVLASTYSYTSQAGWNITIPAIAARSILKRNSFSKFRPKKARRSEEDDY